MMPVLPLIVFLLLVIETGSVIQNPEAVICRESEREALLRFKQELKDATNLLSTWNPDGDCCKWEGIFCDNETGHVTELSLFTPPPRLTGFESDGEYDRAEDAYGKSKLSGKISESLLNLTHLTHLDLSSNDFGGTPIPKFIGSLRNLRHLNLSVAGFGGMIPHELGNLSTLRLLALRSSALRSSSYYRTYVDNLQWLVDNLQWLQGVSLLEHLDMSFVDLSCKASADSLQVMMSSNIFPSLPELRISSCKLFTSTLSQKVNLTSLFVLDISRNHFTSLFPTWILNLSTLTSLDISHNYIKGPIPCGFQYMIALKYLDLSSNNLDSSIPDCLYDVASLENLLLSVNNLQGKLSSAIRNLTSLVHIDLHDNQLEGEIPTSMANLCNLKEIHLGFNKLSGEISMTLDRFSLGCASQGLLSLDLRGNLFFGHMRDDQFQPFQNLQSIILFRNSISGLLPTSIGSLSNLKELSVGENNLEGIVSEVHFANLTKLLLLAALGNPLTLKVDYDWIPPFQILYLYLRSWHLGPQFPSWLKSQKRMVEFDMSSAQISDTIPSWFWNLSSNLAYLNLSHNQIHGQIPSLIKFSEKSSIFLSSNQLGGPLPLIGPNVEELDLSNNSFSGEISNFLCKKIDEPTNLDVLHLGHNQLTGKIPDCWKNWSSGMFINLGRNSLTGVIPDSIGDLTRLGFLNLRDNILSGGLPRSLQKCTTLVVLDIAKNEFSGMIPTWIGDSLSSLMVLSIRSNKFEGEIPSELCRLASLQIMDAADNHLSGKIPKCFNNFTAMVENLNTAMDMLEFYGGPDDLLRRNAYVTMKGSELQYDTILGLVRSLDLSDNNLSGEIPEEVTSLVGLLSLNFSNNNLIGKISDKMGDMKQLQSLDLSRNNLVSQIPATLSGLTFLSYLNLSYNMLSGGIPLSTQMQSFDASSYVGNKLCGPPLTKSCSTRDHTSAQTPAAATNEEEEEGVNWMIVFAVLGFVVGVAGIWLPLLVSKTWRFAYFKFLDCLWFKLDSAFINIWFGLKERIF